MLKKYWYNYLGKGKKKSKEKKKVRRKQQISREPNNNKKEAINDWNFQTNNEEAKTVMTVMINVDVLIVEYERHIHFTINVHAHKRFDIEWWYCM